jgi:hypothetical protein
MPIHSSAEDEHKELLLVATHLERTPRLAGLLRYLAQKYFDGESSLLTEYNIATEVFGRKKSEFVASEDAIARVETHRLRKRLKAYYDAEGKDHSIQIVIPPGTYIPVFVERSAEMHSPPETAGSVKPPEVYEAAELPVQNGDPVRATRETDSRGSKSQVSQVAPPRLRRPLWPYVLVVTVVVVSVLAIYPLVRARSANSARSSIQNRPAPGLPQSTSAPQLAAVAIPFRLIAGYSGPPQRDSTGDVWQADQYFHEGWALHQPAVFVSRTSDPLIFRYGRAGDFSYDIPLKPGIYELHLYFFQPSDTDQSEDAANKSSFNVAMNGSVVLPDFDIVSDAMGRNIADERVIRDVSPAPDGALHLSFTTGVGTPSLSAIQLLNGTPHKQLPIRLITQATSYTDRNGQLWHPDNYFMSGRHVSHTLPATASFTQDLLSSERYGHFTYALPVDPRDRYTVVLHFVELFFGTGEAGVLGSGEGGSGSRVFKVMCNGNTLLDDFDIYKESGSLHMLTKTFHNLKPSAQGKLNLTFEPIKNYATVSEIEVLDESN